MATKTVSVAILGDATSLEKATKDAERNLQSLEDKMAAVGKKFEDSGKKMMDVGGKMSAGITLPIVAVGGVALKMGSDLQETMSKVDVLFGENADKIEAWADTSAESMGTSKQAALDAAAGFKNLFQGIDSAKADDMSTSLTQLGADIGSFNNVSTETANEALAAAFRGEFEPMRQFGVMLDADKIKLKAMQMGLVDANGEVTEAGKQQATYALIMEDTNKQQGDFARTSDGVANSTKIQKARMADLGAEIGTKLLPIATKLIEWASSLLNKFDEMSPKTQTIIMIMVGVAAAIGPVVGVVGALVTGIGLLISPVGLVIVALAALVAGAIYAYQHFEGFRNVVDGVVNWLTGTAWPAMKTTFEALWAVVQVVFDAISNYIKATLSIIDGVIDTFMAIFRGDWSAAWEGIKQIFAGIWGQFTAIVAAIWPAIKGAAETGWSTIAGWFSNLPANMGSLLGGIYDIVTAPFRRAFNAVADLWNNTVGSIEFHVPDWVPAIGGKGWSIPNIPHAATGGFHRGWTMVGERGPEIVNLGAGANVTPNHALGKGGDIIVNVARTNASPGEIASALTWGLRTSGRG